MATLPGLYWLARLGEAEADTGRRQHLPKHGGGNSNKAVMPHKWLGLPLFKRKKNRPHYTLWMISIDEPKLFFLLAPLLSLKRMPSPVDGANALINWHVVINLVLGNNAKIE